MSQATLHAFPPQSTTSPYVRSTSQLPHRTAKATTTQCKTNRDGPSETSTMALYPEKNVKNCMSSNDRDIKEKVHGCKMPSHFRVSEARSQGDVMSGRKLYRRNVIDDVARDAVPNALLKRLSKERSRFGDRRVSRSRETSVRDCSDTSECGLQCKEDSSRTGRLLPDRMLPSPPDTYRIGWHHRRQL